MPTVLTAQAVEQSSFVLEATFYDEEGNLATPSSLTWTLTDSFGTVINGRENVPITATGGIATVTLHGDDLALPHKARNRRVLAFSGTYASSLGTLEIKDFAEFTIVDIVSVS